jgi:spermidine/putrescine-binding protein
MNARRNSGLFWLSAVTVAAILLAACAAGPSPSGGGGGGGGGGGAVVHVAILDKDLTQEQIKGEILKEGSLVVANWTYTANDELVNQFKQYVKSEYGADIEFTYEGSQAPSTYLTNLYAAQKAGNPAPYDVLAIEENYWAEAKQNDAVADFLPSGLVPNEKLVLDQFKHIPTSIAFQSTAFPAIVYNKKSAPFIASLQDLADPRLKGRVTLPQPGDITAGGFFLSLAAELGKDYKDPAQMKEVVDWAVQNIGPNVLKYTTDSSEMQQLLRSGSVDAVSFWNSLARLEYFNGYPDTALLLPKSIYPANGYLWIPKGAQHPVLAQIFINWRLSPEVQFPNAWPIDHGPWSELSEGYLGPDYEGHIPDWFKADYATYYPSLDQIKTQFKQVDWDAYNASSKEWQDYYAQQIGQ